MASSFKGHWGCTGLCGDIRRCLRESIICRQQQFSLCDLGVHRRDLESGELFYRLLRPQLVVFENSPGLLAREAPVDSCPVAIGAAVPDSRFLLQLI